MGFVHINGNWTINKMLNRLSAEAERKDTVFRANFIQSKIKRSYPLA